MNPWLLLSLPCMALCALGFRIRGGWLHAEVPRPGQVSRIVGWGVPCAVTAAAAWAATGGLAAHAWDALPLIPLAWAGATLPLWGVIDMGHNEGSYEHDFILALLHGVVLVMPMAAWLWWIEAPMPGLLVFGGALFAPCYSLAWRAPLPVPGLGLGDPPETGELLFGAAAGGCLFFSVAAW